MRTLSSIFYFIILFFYPEEVVTIKENYRSVSPINIDANHLMIN